MKSFLLAVGILAVILLSVWLGTVAVQRQINRISEAVEYIPLPPPVEYAADLSVQREQVSRILADWTAKEKWLSLLLDHTDMMEVRATMTELYGAAEAGDAMTFSALHARLSYYLEHLSDLTRLSWENVL